MTKHDKKVCQQIMMFAAFAVAEAAGIVVATVCGLNGYTMLGSIGMGSLVYLATVGIGILMSARP